MSEKARAMREELRNGRTAKVSGAGQDTLPNGGGNDLERGTIVQDARRSALTIETVDNRYERGNTHSNAGIAGDQRDTGDDQRSTKRSIIRSRRGSRRSGKSDGGTTASTEATQPIQQPTISQQIGNLVPEGDVPTRLEDPVEELSPLALPQKKKRDRRGYISPQRAAQKAARMEKEPGPPSERKVPFLPQGKKLSATEAETLSETFASTIEDYCKYMDQYLWARQEKAGKSTGERPVWSNLDDEELAAFTRVMMRTGQKNEFAAAAVRGVVESRDYLIAAMIFGPRVAETRKIIVETQVEKPPRVRKHAG